MNQIEKLNNKIRKILNTGFVGKINRFGRERNPSHGYIPAEKPVTTEGFYKSPSKAELKFLKYMGK